MAKLTKDRLALPEDRSGIPDQCTVVKQLKDARNKVECEKVQEDSPKKKLNPSLYQEEQNIERGRAHRREEQAVGELSITSRILLYTALRSGSKPPRLGLHVDHLDGVGYAASRGPPTDHRVRRFESGVLLHGPCGQSQW
ncbi:hypothetical protein LguiA_012775 [Lonicera macranthoides]